MERIDSPLDSEGKLYVLAARVHADLYGAGDDVAAALLAASQQDQLPAILAAAEVLYGVAKRDKVEWAYRDLEPLARLIIRRNLGRYEDTQGARGSGMLTAVKRFYGEPVGQRAAEDPPTRWPLPAPDPEAPTDAVDIIAAAAAAAREAPNGP